MTDSRRPAGSIRASAHGIVATPRERLYDPCVHGKRTERRVPDRGAALSSAARRGSCASPARCVGSAWRAQSIARRVVTCGLAACTIAACAHETRRPPRDPAAGNAASPPPPAASPPQYLVADPGSSHGVAFTLPLGPARFGLLVEKRRVVVGFGEPRVSVDVTPEPLVAAARIPSRFGGGFLFWTASALYRAAAFDGALVPIARVPGIVDSVSFASRSAIVRTREGERWGIGLPNGERVAISPVGMTDIQALDDGRALGWSDRGTAHASTDHGEHWSDVSLQLKSAPSRIAIVDGELWLHDAGSAAFRLELDGHLSAFDSGPKEPPSELRPKDPRWHGSEAPLRAAFRIGAGLDDGTALVVDSGDLVRVDVHSGKVVSSISGRLPPDAQCVALPVVDDVLFACSSQTGTGSAFVVSHTLFADVPTIERTFPGGGHFFAGDDGGLAYDGSCQGLSATPAGPSAVCVRSAGGTWEESDVSGLSIDGGAVDAHVARWIPRADGHVVAVVLEPVSGIYEPRSGRLTPIADETKDLLVRGSSSYPSSSGKTYRPGRLRKLRVSSELVDTSWSFAGDGWRGWQRHGESVAIGSDGALSVSAWSLDVVFSGASGVGRSKDGRLYQSLDHGASWEEVATPPSGLEATDLVSCTSAGCDLGAFYRVGWSPAPPVPSAAPTLARAAPNVRLAEGVVLSCRSAGPVAMRFLSRTSESPEDLGLGASRLPVAGAHPDWSFVRSTIARGITSPIHPIDGSDGDSTPSLRAVLSGFGTSNEGEGLVASGPDKNVLHLRRALAYVAPFDPSGKVLHASIAMSEVVAAGRRAGLSTEEILAADLTEAGLAIPLTSLDPSLPSDIAIHNAEHGLLAVARGDRARIAVRPTTNNANVISGVALVGDELAFLEVESSGVGHVFKVGRGGASDLFDALPASNESYYPANPDALAIGPAGDLGVLRLPSGREPASALDAAHVVGQTGALTVLAPWSETKLASDAECKVDASGYRAVVQVVAPWIKVETAGFRVLDQPMIARVRWSPARVCLEGFEVQAPSVGVRVGVAGGGEEPMSVATWIVGKGSTFARVGVSDGVEWRQALECNVTPPRPRAESELAGSKR